ncbi:MAG: hypothetical protein LBR80_04745 [Deltaproteobacteria bacterium]|jgi:hypothetical protein|nr:hypothetical protein [Deltaproteobacteria bacterium]
MTSGETDSITRAEAEAALKDPEKGSLAVLKAVGKQRDLYARELQTGARELAARTPFEEVCAETAIRDFKEDLAGEGLEIPDGLAVIRPGKATGPAGDPSAITREEAEAALKDPEKGSLAVLKAVGKLRDRYARELLAGARELHARNPFEEVCAEAAVRDFLEDLAGDDQDPPQGIKVVKAAQAPPQGPDAGKAGQAPPQGIKAVKASQEYPKVSGDTASITREEAEAALKDPEKGSLAVLKAVGRLRDLYARELQTGARTLKAKNPFEEVCAEAALRDYLEDLGSEGMDLPDGLAVVRTGT